MTDAAPVFEAAEARAMWRVAKNWLVVWTSAGFPARIEGDKLFMPKGWQERFPDGPELLRALRTEIFALVRDGNKAVLEDPRLKVAYPQYLTGLLDAEATKLKHAENCARRSREEIARLEKELEKKGPVR